MMHLRIESFKAFKEIIEIEFENKNLLLYGENGAGKSSIYEALKIIFFKGKIESSLTLPDIPEDRESFLTDFWDKYNNRDSTDSFKIIIDGSNYFNFDTSSYLSFFISLEEIRSKKEIYLNKLISRLFLSIENIEDFCNEEYGLIQNRVNESLKSFKETVLIDIEKENDFRIKIIDSSRNLENNNSLDIYFNEAKIAYPLSVQLL